MIIGLAAPILAAVSVHVRRFINEAAVFVVGTIVWTFLRVAVPLDRSRPGWRLIAVGAPGLVLVTVGRPM